MTPEIVKDLPFAQDPKPSFLRSTKLRLCHFAKTAFIYVRQSTANQVLNNRESTARQYSLVEHAASLGWLRDRIQIIDEDQGMSGASAEGRSGFQRLLFAQFYTSFKRITSSSLFVLTLVQTRDNLNGTMQHQQWSIAFSLITFTRGLIASVIDKLTRDASGRAFGILDARKSSPISTMR